MKHNFKHINLGYLIRQRVLDYNITISRICLFFNTTETEIYEMYNSESLDSKTLLKWSKLLKYDFFRLYSQHLILYSPPTARDPEYKDKNILPQFRKNIYTKEIIDFILEILETGYKTKDQIMAEYGIPKTTLHKWISKYKK
ncbi:transposase [Chryseobacterium sp. HMWF035]|nr:transposase [Chryseobacterium sp. EO14]MCQ4138767.1 transposase [Chryseobacterium sp. EO14]PTT71133.1 transposase [Chryseobacterium sp. HMWF001]PVV55326.1 transposase [Chryseobacterium sp. HMWF035]